MEVQATSPPLSTEEEKLLAFDSDNESATSSGYSSGNPSLPEYWSDTDSEDSCDSDDDDDDDDEDVFNDENEEGNGPIFDNDDKIMTYENTRPVINTLEYILSMPTLCDVRFIVGEDKTEIGGLKAVLASRNRKFCQMFIEEETKLKEREENVRITKKKFSVFKKKANKTTDTKLTVSIGHYNCDVFDKILMFLHLGQVCVTPETVIGLMCAAEEYDIPELQKACWDFSFRCLSNGNITTIVKSSNMYRGRTAADQFMYKLHEMSQGPKTTSV